MIFLYEIFKHTQNIIKSVEKIFHIIFNIKQFLYNIECFRCHCWLSLFFDESYFCLTTGYYIFARNPQLKYRICGYDISQIYLSCPQVFPCDDAL